MQEKSAIPNGHTQYCIIPNFNNMGDVAKGARLFKSKCNQCHTSGVGEGHKLGPALQLGRTSGTSEGFNYTPANRASGVEWGEDTLSDYLNQPKRYIPGTKMNFAGMRRPADRQDLIAYIKSFD